MLIGCERNLLNNGLKDFVIDFFTYPPLMFVCPHSRSQFIHLYTFKLLRNLLAVKSSHFEELL